MLFAWNGLIPIQPDDIYMTRQPSLVVVRTLVVLGLAATLWVRSGQPVGAQGGITITSPAANSVLKAGPDFAGDTLSDPWDFSNREDVALDPAQIRGFSSFAVNGSTNPGLAGGTLDPVGDASGTNVYLLQRAYYGILNPGRTGRRYPISSGIYTKLALKMSSAVAGQLPRVFWFHNDLADPGGDASGWRFLQPQNTLGETAGSHIYVLDLTQSNFGVPWTSGNVKGFAMYPNSKGVGGYDVQFDWVRLTTGDSHPASTVLPVTWSGGTGTTTIDVKDALGTSFTVATVASGNTYNWNYGVLPPGSYTVTVTRGSLSGTQPFRINAPPTIHVTDPDETGGEDFATAVLGNPWDMNDTADFRQDVNIVDHLTIRSVFNGQFTGYSDGATVDHTTDPAHTPIGDPQVYFLSSQKDTDTAVIDTHKYHRLTFALYVEHAFSLQLGSVARVLWGSASSQTGGGTPYDVTTSKDIITWPGWNNYTLDLTPLTAAADGGLEIPNATPWTTKNVRHLRIDPFEFAEKVWFHYGPVKLAADDETTNGSFTIHFTGSDPDGDAATVALYYDTDQDTSSGLTLITSSVALSAGQYVWNTSQVPTGTYYIYAVANDGRNAVGQYSTGPVKVVNFAPTTNPLINVDTPAPSATVTSAFEVGGWAIDAAAASGTGVDAVQFYVFPNDGASPGVFIGTGSYGRARTDVGGAFGSQFTNSGFHFTITGLGPGNYLLGVYGHSTVTNAFSVIKTVHFTVNANALMSIDVPSAEAIITSPTFSVAGWAMDRAIESGNAIGTGVDTLHVYAFPNPGSGQPAIFLGVATVGIQRGDVVPFYGERYRYSGYSLNVNAAGLTPGVVYNIVVWAHSTVSASFNNAAVVRVTIQ